MKKNIEKYKWEIIMTIIFLTIGAIILIVSKRFEFQDSTNLNKLTELIFGNLIGLVSIWISGYFILIQLYKNTYPMEIIEKNFLKKVKMILIYSVLNILVGILIISAFNNYVTEIYYIILFAINVSIVFYYTYTINREFTINNYVDNFFYELIDSLEKENLTRDDVDKIFKDFHKFFDECIIKDEYYVCNNISKKIGRLFEKLIEYCNKMLLNNEEEMAEYIFEKIINSGVYQISYAKDSKTESLISNLFIQQEKNIKICIKIGKIDWFKKYIKKINLLFKEYNNNQNRILDELYDLNMEIGITLLEKDDAWLKWFIDELYNINISLKYAFKNINLNYFGKFLIYIMVKDVEENKMNNNKYSILIRVLKKYTCNITHINDNIEDIVIYYSFYGNKLIENKCKEKIKDFIDIITNRNNRMINNEKWNEYILYYLNLTMQEWNEDFGEFNRKMIINIILELSLNNSNSNYYSFLPEYSKIMQMKKYDSKLMNDIYDEFEELFIRLVINNNVNMFYVILRILKDSILELGQRDRNAQEKLFDLYLGNLVRAVNIENKKFIELTISAINDTVEELDRNKKISNQFGNHIIENIADVAIYRSRIKETNVINVINLLSDFLEEKKCNFVISDNQRKKLLYKSIYNIGISCIENNMEKALRSVSNRLGWFIIGSIKNNDSPELTKYLLDRTIDLFKIAKNMEISEKTLVFIMTLFTTVGTYCYKDAKYNAYKNKIFEILIEEKEYIRAKTAIELRTKENNMWDKLFEGQTELLTQKFLRELNQKNISPK